MNLSIIIPLFNAERYIDHLLKSIYNQCNSPIDFEVIIIDDCSVDNSSALISNFVQRYDIDNLNYIKLTSNQGTANARNVGLSIAAGQWIQFVDSDDRLPDNYFKQVTSLLEQPTVECYIYGVKYIHEDHIVTHSPSAEVDARMIGYKNVVVNKIYKRYLLDNFETDYTFEDVIWLVKLMSKSPECEVIEKLYYPVNRQNEESKMANSKSEDWYKMARSSIKQAKTLTATSRQFALETFVGTLRSKKFKLRHRLPVAIAALISNLSYLPFVITYGIRKLDHMTIEYKKK